ncbi:hypothetical protein MBLNU457_1477t1 [Dothideomycetes sp. NU457]
MPWSMSTVTWAIPVSVGQLIGHLEAHKKMKATIDTLRLCNRFGKGPNAKVTKLPVELVEMIEQEILREPRATAARAWERRHACIEQRCQPLDHFHYFELKEFARIVMGISAPWDDEPDCQPSEPESDFDFDGSEFGSQPDTDVKSLHLKENMKLYLKGEFQCDCNAHQEFRKKLINFASGELEDYPDHDFEGKEDWEVDMAGLVNGDLSKILKDELGVEAIVEQHMVSDWYDSVTVCYLALPSKAAKNDYMMDFDIGARDFQCSVIDQDSLRLAEQHKKRLRYAMSVLSLDVCVHSTQFKDDIISYRASKGLNAMNPCSCCAKKGAQTEEARMKRYSELSWPQLLLITKSGEDL